MQDRELKKLKFKEKNNYFENKKLSSKTFKTKEIMPEYLIYEADKMITFLKNIPKFKKTKDFKRISKLKKATTKYNCNVQKIGLEDYSIPDFGNYLTFRIPFFNFYLNYDKYLDFIPILPIEILIKILHYLEPVNILEMAHVSKEWNKIITTILSKKNSFNIIYPNECNSLYVWKKTPKHPNHLSGKGGLIQTLRRKNNYINYFNPSKRKLLFDNDIRFKVAYYNRIIACAYSHESLVYVFAYDVESDIKSSIATIERNELFTLNNLFQGANSFSEITISDSLIALIFDDRISIFRFPKSINEAKHLGNVIEIIDQGLSSSPEHIMLPSLFLPAFMSHGLNFWDPPFDIQEYELASSGEIVLARILIRKGMFFALCRNNNYSNLLFDRDYRDLLPEWEYIHEECKRSFFNVSQNPDFIALCYGIPLVKLYSYDSVLLRTIDLSWIKPWDVSIAVSCKKRFINLASSKIPQFEIIISFGNSLCIIKVQQNSLSSNISAKHSIPPLINSNNEFNMTNSLQIENSFNQMNDENHTQTETLSDYINETNHSYIDYNLQLVSPSLVYTIFASGSRSLNNCRPMIVCDDNAVIYKHIKSMKNYIAHENRYYSCLSDEIEEHLLNKCESGIFRERIVEILSIDDFAMIIILKTNILIYYYD